MHDCIGIEFSRLNLCFVLQNLKTCRKLRRGAMVMNKQGEGFSWLASGNMPFTIEHKFKGRACPLLGLSKNLKVRAGKEIFRGRDVPSLVERTICYGV